MFASVMDEAAFFQDKSERSNAQEMYDILQHCHIMRFADWYKMLVISSVDKDDDFIVRNVKRISKEGQEVEF